MEVLAEMANAIDQLVDDIRNDHNKDAALFGLSQIAKEMRNVARDNGYLVAPEM